MTYDCLLIGEKTMKTLITVIRSVVALVGVAGRTSLSIQFMKTNLNLLQTRIFCAVALGIGSFFGLSAATKASADTPPATTAIPWSQLGAKAGADYQGDALAVIPTAGGARLRCAFQRLEGEATREGLWLTSTVIPPGGTVNDRFRIVAAELGRAAHFGVRRQGLRFPIRANSKAEALPPHSKGFHRLAGFRIQRVATGGCHASRGRLPLVSRHRQLIVPGDDGKVALKLSAVAIRVEKENFEFGTIEMQ